MPYLSDRQYGLLPHRRLLIKLKNSASITRRLQLGRTLNVHTGCVNTICWNDCGSMILSGSDDQHLIVTDPFTTKILTRVHSGHRENIFSAKFLPETNDRRVVSCSGDGVIFQTDFDRPNQTHSNDGCFTCHGSTTAYEVRVIPHTPNLFLSCSDDCTVRLFDLRTKSSCLKAHCTDDILIRSKWGITSIDINPMNPNEIVCACSDSSVRLYDHRKLSTRMTSEASTTRRCEASISGLISRFLLTDRKEPRPPRITSVVFNQYGTEVLASYSSESLYLLDPKQSISQDQLKECLTEHRNEKRSRNSVSAGKTATGHKHGNDSSAKQDSTPTPEQQRASHFKRLRLRGDWSDTGPESRPSGENEPEASAAQSASPDQSNDSTEQRSPPSANNTDESPTGTTTRSRHLQNFFMQRMSDILTQLVTRATVPTETTQSGEEGETAERTTNDSDQPQTDATPPAPEVTSTSPAASEDPVIIPTMNSPIVEHPPSPPPVNESIPTTNNTDHVDDEDDDNESEDSHGPRGIFEIIFGSRRRGQADDDDEDENSMDEDEGDDEDSRSPSATANAASPSSASAATATTDQSSARARRPLMAAKLDRIIKRRDAERRHEENLLKDVPSLGLLNSYDGHRNARTMIKEANFWSDSYVMSGSDCGHIFIWNKFTGNIIRIISADDHVVNCLQPHPLNYPILASSGIDYNIKLFSPVAESPIDDSALITHTVKRNHAMIEETSSTITVPAAFMFRMLTSFYRLPRADDDMPGVGDDESTE